MPGRGFCIPRPGAQIDSGLAQVQGWLSAKPSPFRAQQVPPVLGCRGVSSQELTTALCSQGKGRRESEGPTSCRRPSGRSPTSAEKCMSFESVSSLPEVSGQQAEGASCSGAWSPGLLVCRLAFQTVPLGPCGGLPTSQDSRPFRKACLAYGRVAW